MNFKLHHVAITVKSLEDSIQWYKDVLSFSLVKKYESDTMQIALMQLDDIRIEMFDFGKQAKPLPQ